MYFRILISYINIYIMKTLQDHKADFLKQAMEFDTGKKEEDFHAYLRHHNLEHHLSQTQIADRNRDSNYLNAVGLTLGIGVPLTLGAMFGVQKLTSGIMGHGGHEDFNYELARELTGYREPRYNADALHESNSLSGINTRSMPMANSHIGQDIPSHSEAVSNAVLTASRFLGNRLFKRQQQEERLPPMEDDVPLINQNDPRQRQSLL